MELQKRKKGNKKKHDMVNRKETKNKEKLKYVKENWKEKGRTSEREKKRERKSDMEKRIPLRP